MFQKGSFPTAVASGTLTIALTIAFGVEAGILAWVCCGIAIEAAIVMGMMTAISRRFCWVFIGNTLI